MRKAPCISADQSQMQGTRPNQTTGGLVLIVYHGPRENTRRIFLEYRITFYHQSDL